jgi:hypothetical protein
VALAVWNGMPKDDPRDHSPGATFYRNFLPQVVESGIKAEFGNGCDAFKCRYAAETMRRRSVPMQRFKEGWQQWERDIPSKYCHSCSVFGG